MIIGNTHQHWGHFVGAQLGSVEHLPRTQRLKPSGEVWLASVVPAWREQWQPEPDLKLNLIDLSWVPLGNLYASLGIDRALTVLGAGETRGWPVLVIDAGTALTLTGADAQRALVGGAILPGLGLQLSSLRQHTAALPTVARPESLPPRWAQDTANAIRSGVLYTLLAGVRDFLADWQRQFPTAQVVVTGGDGPLLARCLALPLDPHLGFWGLRAVRQQVQLGQ